MSGFSAEWLSLREPYDLAARNATVRDAVAGAFAGLGSIALVDLACGTGATLRAVGGHLPPRQSWRLVDNDLSLLARASALGRPPDLVVTTRPVDLVRDLELALDGPLDRHLPVYAALSYDGRTVIEPRAALDAEIVAAFNLHQRTDKGFGPALGPTAAARAVERFEHFGYSVVHGRSDWVMGPDDRDIQDALFAGWAELGVLTVAMSADASAGWLAERRALLADGRSHLRVGHVDVFARPIGRR
jgi:hypothetical protein